MWKKRLVSMAMALVLAVSLLPTTAWAWSVDTFDELKRELGYGGTRTIPVTGTIEVTETLVIPAEAKITITGGGTLKRAASFTRGYMFRLNSSFGAYERNKASLTLENITVDGGGVKASDPAFSLGSNAFLTLKAGAVIQNHVCTSAYEGTVYVAGGVLTMETGSVIRNNTTAGNGGGVNCGAGSFIMHGGTITGNTAAKGGGGVYSASCPTDDDSMTDQGKGFVIGDRTAIDRSGVIRIENNTLSDGTTNNVGVCLYSESYGNIDTSANPCAVQYGTFDAAKSYIGVSAEIVPSLVVKHTYPAMQAAFHSDNAAYALTSGSGGLWMKGAEDGAHTHCVCVGHYAADSSHFTHNDKTAWTGVSSLKAITTAGNYYLLNDVEVEFNNSISDYVWQPVSGVKLCLNGHSIIGKNNNARSMIEVNSGVTFDLTDCKTTGTVTHGENYWGEQATGRAVDIGYGSYSTTATFNLWGGSITGNFCNDSAGGVYNTGTFTMENGTLTGNKALNYTDSRTDAAADKDACGNGGGLYNASGATAKIENAVITKNISSARSNGLDGEGAGIFTKGTLYIGTTSSSVVEIYDNEAKIGSDTISGGGGVCVRSNNVKLIGQVKIYDNTSTASSHPDKDDNLYVGYDNYGNNFTFSAAGLKLTGKEHIGITTQATYAKVQITNDNANAVYFYPDSNDYQIVSENGKLYRREAQFKATIHLGKGMKVSVKPNGGELSPDGKTLTFESVTNIPYFEIAPDGDHYLPKSYKDAIKDMNSPLSASWYSNTRVQLSGYDSKLTKELELWLPDATAKDAPGAPTGLAGTMPEENDTAYGFITGTSSLMEYSKDGTTWTRCSYGTTRVPLDKKSANSPIYKDTVYYVRYRDTETQKVSEATTVTMPRYTGVVAVPVPRTDMVYRNRGYFVFEGDPDYYKAHYITVEGTYIHTKAGTYTVKVKPEDGYTWVGGGTDPVTLTVTIAKRTATASDFEVVSCPANPTPYTGEAQTYEIRFAWPESPVGSRLAFANSNNKLTLKYKVGDTNTFVTEPVDVGTYTLYIDVPDDPNFNATTVTDKDGGWTFTITPADMKAPTGVTGVAATKEHPTTGQLTGLGTDMEYRVKGSETWTAATGNTVDVTLNTENGYPVDTVFEVRYKADKNHTTSDPAQVTVKAYQCVEHVYGETLVSDEANHWYQCTVCGAKTGIAAHSYTDAKFDGNGHWAVCACGAETHHDEHSLTAKHNESQHWQECVCGYKTGVAAHSLTKNVNETQHQVKCESCGYKTEWENHTGGTATCTAKAVCSVCGESYGELAAHVADSTYKYNGEGHWTACATCGTPMSNQEAHTGGTADCQHKAVCDVCGQPYGELDASNHTGGIRWVQTAETHQAFYLCCGAAAGAEANHSWNDESVCTECGYGCAHTGGTATCTALAVCDICGHTYGDLLPHDYRWVIDQEATTEATGLKHEECTACGDKRSEGTVIPKQPRHSSSVSTPDIQPILTADEAKSATDYSGGIYGLTFRASTGYGSFKGVKVNGKTIGAGNYIAEENGGTEIYLKAAYLQTLAPGKYTMTVMTESGEVTTEFTVGGVMTAPKTADAGALVYLTMALSSYTGTALVARKRRKEF